ncbi:MAG: hypothetical protein AAB953_01445 [Patescibacteria group bacterium]
MKKITKIFLVLLSIAAIFTACTTKTTEKTNDQTDNIKTAAPITAEAKVDFIEFEATLINDDPNNTKIQLSMNNHQEDLSAFDYKNISKLDGQSAEKWEEESNGIGGHHLSGTLTFPKTENPNTLTITGLPVGEVVLKFNQTK